MKQFLLVLIVFGALAFSAAPAFLQETGNPHAQHEHGTAGGGTTQQGGMMCPMMGSGSMGMMGGMGGMMGRMGGTDPKMMGRMMQMRGEMMMKMGEVMMKHGKMMQQEHAK